MDMNAAATSVQDVLTRLHHIDDELPPEDGIAVFNHMYCTVTEQVDASLTGDQFFRGPNFMTHLDVTFASFWLEAYDAPANALPKAWSPLFERRDDRSVLPIQFAVAGMNSHIGHDLPVAVVRTCRDLDTSPHDSDVRRDYDKVNDLLAACESEVRRSFLTEAGQAIDREVGSVIHLISTWDIDKAREVAWVNAETLWSLQDLGSLATRYEVALAHTVGMTSRCLLTSVRPS
jgi:hypothetical protein